jgi:hypothetical protein
MQIHRVNPFQAMRTSPPAVSKAGAAPSAAAGGSPSTASSVSDPPSFLANFNSVMASGPSTPAVSQATVVAVPPMPAATYHGPNAMYDESAINARTSAASSMLAAVGSNDLKGYQQAAANFLAASPAGSGLPVWASTITVDLKGNLINTNCAGVAFDGTVVPEGGCGYAGMRNPVPGTPNIADGSSNYLGAVTNRLT